VRAVNLIPTEQRGGVKQGAGRSGGVAYALLGLLGALAVLVYLYGSAHAQISRSHAKAASLSVQAQRVEATAAQLAPYTSFIALRDERMKAVSTLVDTRFDWAHAFREFGRVLPGAVTLTTLSGTIAPAAASPAPAAPSTSSGSSAPASSGSSAPAASPSASTGSSAGPASPPASTSSGGAAAPASTGTTSSTGASAAPAVSSATPAGSIPVFTIGGCAATQATVAQTLERLRLIDGVSGVTLQSSIKTGASVGASSTAGCPANYPVFTMQVTFDALPDTAGGSSGATPVSAPATPAPATQAPATPAPSTPARPPIKRHSVSLTGVVLAPASPVTATAPATSTGGAK
jgi:hypothetical protein